MAHKTVVRNQSCQLSSFTIRERHNERKNEQYFNGDVFPERSNMNVHFMQRFRPNGTPETYHETFNRMLEEKTIVKHGTKADAKLFCEMVFDINTSYFEERGGYEFAKKYYEEAYNLAVKEAGSEDYIISAVMHADERNKALSEQYGRDIFHYHLHVVYVPIVQKKLYFRKNNKDPNLAGKLKEIIPQISQNRKWPPRVQVERNGKFYTVNSYSLLQDRYHNHMKEMGFDGFERGERGSTTEHLEVLDYKIQQDTKRLDTITKQVEQKTAKLNKLDEQITNREKIKTNLAEIDAMGRPSKVSNDIVFTQAEAKKLKTLAKKYPNANKRVNEATRKQKAAEEERDKAVAELAKEKKKHPTMSEHLTWFDKFITAFRRAPKRLKAVIDEIMRSPPEQVVPERTQPEKTKKRDRSEER